MAVNAGISQGYSQSGQSGGSINSGQTYNNSFNMSTNDSYASSASGTDATTAREWSAMAADQAWSRDIAAMQMQMGYNAAEAQKQRDWQEKMANTIYTRSVKNMKKAGINPILAANMGLSGASVGSGATASLSGVPSAPLAQNFMDSWSASESYSHGSSYGEGEGGGWSNGSSWNNGWSNSEEGIVTALQGLSGMADSALNLIQSGDTIDAINQYLGGDPNDFGNIGSSIRHYVVDPIENAFNKITGKGTENQKEQNKQKGDNHKFFR